MWWERAGSPTFLRVYFKSGRDFGPAVWLGKGVEGMNSLIFGGIDYIANKLIGWIIWLVGIVADGISHLALVQASLPWVQNVKSGTEAVAWTLLGLYIAYKAFHSYIMWNEGTADPDGSVLAKSILRTVIYVALSGTVATLVFQWGIDLSASITGTTMLHAAQSFHGLWGNIIAIPGALIGFNLAMLLAVGIGIVLLLIVSLQMAIRAAELVIYVVAAPIVALGQMNADGGTWSSWWANLVILSLSQAVQMLCFVGLVESTQVLTSPADTAWIAAMARHMPLAAPVAMADSVIATALNLVFAVLLMIGWLVVAVRGPHLLKQWAYRSGVGGGIMYVGTSVGRSVGQGYGKQIMARIGPGKS